MCWEWREKSSLGVEEKRKREQQSEERERDDDNVLEGERRKGEDGGAGCQKCHGA
jgi:hypothetical protein